jgi:hypothetical protein
MDMNDDSQGVSYRLVTTFIVLALACSVGLVIAISMGYEYVRKAGNQPSDYEKALRPHTAGPEKTDPSDSTPPPTAFPAP